MLAQWPGLAPVWIQWSHPKTSYAGRKKGSLPRRQGRPSALQPACTEARSESWLADQQRFLSSSETPGRSWDGGTHNAWSYPACYHLRPGGTGRKRVSIPAEPHFRREQFTLSQGRAGPCHAFDTRTSGIGLWLPWGERDHRAVCHPVAPQHCQGPSSCQGSCRSPSDAVAPAPALPGSAVLCPGHGHLQNSGMGRGQSWCPSGKGLRPWPVAEVWAGSNIPCWVSLLPTPGRHPRALVCWENACPEQYRQPEKPHWQRPSLPARRGN